MKEDEVEDDIEYIGMKEDIIENDSMVDEKAIQKKAEEVATMLKKSNFNDKKCVYKPVFLFRRNHNSSYKR